MHRFRFRADIRKFKLVCLLFLLRGIGALSLVPVLVIGLVVGKVQWLWASGGILAATLTISLLFLLMRDGPQCPICKGRIMSHVSCVKHRKARRLLGSYRLQIVVSAIFTGSFRCQYCGEPTKLESRHK